jgi:hypothetical protein
LEDLHAARQWAGDQAGDADRRGRAERDTHDDQGHDQGPGGGELGLGGFLLFLRHGHGLLDEGVHRLTNLPDQGQRLVLAELGDLGVLAGFAQRQQPIVQDALILLPGLVELGQRLDADRTEGELLVRVLRLGEGLRVVGDGLLGLGLGRAVGGHEVFEDVGPGPVERVTHLGDFAHLQTAVIHRSGAVVDRRHLD